MKIVKITNLITSEYYYQRVEDDDSRRDPDGLFQLLINNGSSKDIFAIDTTIVARNLSPEIAVTKLIEFRIKSSKDELHRTPRKNTVGAPTEIPTDPEPLEPVDSVIENRDKSTLMSLADTAEKTNKKYTKNKKEDDASIEND